MISGAADTFEGSSPHPHESPPGSFHLKDSQHSATISSGVTSKSDKHHRHKKRLESIPNIVIDSGDSTNIRNLTLQKSKSFLKHLDQSSVRLENSRGSCPDITVPQVSSPRIKRRRHKGRHRQQHADNVASDSPVYPRRLNMSSPHLDEPSSEGYKPSQTLPIPTSSIRCVHSELSKSAPCDTWCFMDPVDLDEEACASPCPPTLSDSPPFRIRACTSPETMYSREEPRTSNNSWFSRVLPLFSSSSGGNEAAGQVCSQEKI